MKKIVTYEEKGRSKFPINYAMQAPRVERGRAGKDERTAKKVTNRQELNFLLRAGTSGLRVIRSRDNI